MELSSTARSKCGLTSSSSYRRITTNRSLLWVTSSGSRVLHEGVARGGGGVQYDRLIDVLTVQCNSVAMEMIGWSFSSPARSTDFHVSTSNSVAVSGL